MPNNQKKRTSPLGQTVLNNLRAASRTKYNAEFVRYLLDELKSSYEDNYQKLICQLILAGAKVHPIYGKEFERIESEFKKQHSETSSQL